MISSKFNFFFLLLFHAALFPYNFLDRLNVPIFISSSFSSGYDTNIFRLSEFERDFEYNKKIPTINSDYFDDFYVSPKISIRYSPYILKKDFLGIDKTQFNFSLSRTQYISTEEKSYNIIFSEFGVKFGPYNWIKIHHRMLPEYYLRNYIDQDSNSSKYSPSIFSSESFGASYSNRLGRSVWFRCKYTKTNLYYNVDFTEFDTEIKQFEVKFNLKYNRLNSSIWVGYADGDNSSFDSGYLSSGYDRSYKEAILGISLNRKIVILNVIDRLGFSSITKNRAYVSESVSDPLHANREHYEYTLSLWAEKKLNRSLSHQFKIKYRARDVFSDYYVNYVGGTDTVTQVGVADLKSFDKLEFIYKIMFNTHLDFLL